MSSILSILGTYQSLKETKTVRLCYMWNWRFCNQLTQKLQWHLTVTLRRVLLAVEDCTKWSSIFRTNWNLDSANSVSYHRQQKNHFDSCLSHYVLQDFLSENYEVTMYVSENPGPGQLNESLLSGHRHGLQVWLLTQIFVPFFTTECPDS